MADVKEEQQQQQQHTLGVSGRVTAHMHAAVAVAESALSHGEVCVGCVFVDSATDVVIAGAHNETNATGNASRHAELVAIDAIVAKHTHFSAADWSRVDVYVTVEPCIMCAWALKLVGIRHVYFGCRNDRFGGCGSVYELQREGDYGCTQVCMCVCVYAHLCICVCMRMLMSMCVGV
jgi:tRNA(Arg) A34 adenosine deaminase TadA